MLFFVVNIFSMVKVEGIMHTKYIIQENDKNLNVSRFCNDANFLKALKYM